MSAERYVHRRSLAATLSVVMVAVAVVPLAIVAIQGYHCAAMAVVELRSAHLRSVLEARKSRINDWLRERSEDLVALSICPGIRAACLPGEPQDSGHTEACHLLDRGHARSGTYEGIALYSPEWTRLAASSQTVHEDALLVPQELQGAIASSGTDPVTLPFLNAAGAMSVRLGMRVPGSEGALAGYLVSAVDLSRTLNAILEDDRDLSPGMRTYIVTQDGRHFSPATAAEFLGPGRKVTPTDLLAGDGTAPVSYCDGSGEEVLGKASLLPDLGWILVAEIRTAEAYAWLTALRRRAVATAVLAFALVVLLALRSSRHVTSPLRELARAARDVSRGQYTRRVDPLPGREPGDVAAAFNSMLDELDEARQRLVRAAGLSAIGELSSSIVHEMRNPLSSVKMNLKALRQKVDGDPTHAELADIASGQVARLEQMLNDLLQYGKPLELEKQPLVFAALLEDVLEAVSALADSRSVEVRVHDATAGQSIAGDREQLRRAVTNLADNAIRASSEGTEIIVSGRVEVIDPAAELVVCVEDSGTGIPDNVRARLFEPFFTARGDGTGLGLANVRKIVELHGGTVSGENRAEGGARFTIRLPLGNRHG